MKTKPENPAAFPIFFPTDGECEPAYIEGMSLRDYFAAQAMASIFNVKNAPTDFKTVSAWAYQLADCMLAEREKTA